MHGRRRRHRARRVERERGARVVGDHGAGRARDRVAGDDVVRVVVREHHALDGAGRQPRPEHGGGADAAEAHRAPVDVHGHAQVRVEALAAALVERVAHADDGLVEAVDVGHGAAVHAHAEERQVDHAQHGHAVLEQPEHHPAQRGAGGVVDRAVERVGDPHAAAVQIGAAALLAEEADVGRRARQRAPSSPPPTRGPPRSGSPWPPCRSAPAARRGPPAGPRPPASTAACAAARSSSEVHTAQRTRQVERASAPARRTR